MVRKALVAAIILIVVGAGSAAGAAPSTGAVPSIRRTGHCDGTTTWSLSVTQYDATRLRVRFALANSTPGQTWQLFGSDNGVRVFLVNRVVSPTGTASVRRYVKDRPGTDTIKATGLNSIGEGCIASLAY